jgi:hypothetical protein
MRLKVLLGSPPPRMQKAAAIKMVLQEYVVDVQARQHLSVLA